MAPIRMGRVPGERRTFEQRLRQVIDRIDGRTAQGIPSPLNRIQTVHFGRLLVIRPEQYLYHSNIEGVAYQQEAEEAQRPDKRIPLPMDDFREVEMNAKNPSGETGDAQTAQYRSYLLTIVSFDGDLKPYFRDIADFLGEDFDRLFENCEDFDTTADFEGFWAWIRRYQISVDLFFAAYPDLTVAEIKRLQFFKDRFDDFVARARGTSANPPAEFGRLFDDFLRENHHYGSGFPNPSGLFRTAD